jgi:hypothetical protein
LTLFPKFSEGSYLVVNAAELGAGGKANPKPISVGGNAHGSANWLIANRGG